MTGERKTTQILSLAALDTIQKRGIEYDAINTQWRKLQGDFPSYTPALDGEITEAVVKLLDYILGDGLASYLLYECNRGPGAIHDSGKVWPIACVDDIRRYLERNGEARDA